MGQSQFRADGFGFGFRSKLNDSAVSSIGTDMDGQARLLASTRLSHVTERHHHSLSVVYKSHSQDPYAVLVLDHLGNRPQWASQPSPAPILQPPFGGGSPIGLDSQPDRQSLRIHERTAYLSPSGALRDLESRLQSDTSFELAHQGPTRYGLGILVVLSHQCDDSHRTSGVIQLHIDY